MNNARDLKSRELGFNQLFVQYQQRFIRFACSYVQDEQLAEDFTADAFMSFWENRSRLAPDTNPPAYILAAIKNRCINHLHHQQVRLRVEKKLTDHSQWVLDTRIATLEACEPNHLFTSEIQEIVEKTLDRLPKKTKEIYTMSRNAHLSHKEIALNMGISVKGVEFHISKTINKLRGALKDYLL